MKRKEALMENGKKVLLAVDGNSILNRAYYGVRPLTTQTGLYTHAVYGMITMLQKQIETVSPSQCVIAFDLKAPTFRHKMYDGYKANRKGMPPELAMQLPYAKACARAMGFTLIEKEGFEADDILGTVAAKASENEQVYIFTGDRDSLQLIGDHVSILLAGTGETVVYDRAKFFEKYGIRVEQFVDLKALMGDSSDNIPGVPGIGEKTAIKLISEFGSLEALYENYKDATLSPSIKTKLEAGKESAFLSQKLARIFCQVDLGVDLSEISYQGNHASELLPLFTELEFSALIQKMHLAEEQAVPTDAKRQVKTSRLPKDRLDKVEGNVFLYSTPAGLEILVENVGEVWLCENTSKAEALGALMQNEIHLVTYDCKALYKELAALKIERKNDCAFDVMLGAYVLNPSGSFDLPRLVTQYLNEAFDSTVPGVSYVKSLYEGILPVLEERNQHRLMFDIEMPLAHVLADMELSGFRIDTEGLAHYGEQLAQLERAAEERIYYFAGGDFNINSPKQLGEILFERLGLPNKGKKTKTGYSTNAETLEKLRPYHPIIEEILEYRQFAKLRSTYVDGLLKAADADGRVHTNFKQTGTATGRLSSTEPNLQNIPIRTALGRDLRRYFLPRNSEYVLLDADYSQIELRLLADISGDKNMIEAFLGGVDIHASTAAAVFGVPIEAVTPEQRKRAKAVNFGIVYGISAFSLAQDLGISRAAANAYIENYMANYPGVSQYLKDIVASAHKTGFVSTAFGRRRYIPELSGQNKVLKAFGERVAMNSPIQGTAADIIKIAMIHVSERLKRENLDARLILQVHDELLIECAKTCADQAACLLREEMEHAVTLKVPLVAEVTMGETWYNN